MNDNMLSKYEEAEMLLLVLELQLPLIAQALGISEEKLRDDLGAIDYSEFWRNLSANCQPEL